MPVVTHQVSYPLLSGGIHEVRQQNIKSGEHGGDTVPLTSYVMNASSWFSRWTSAANSCCHSF